jgi:chemotaxis protein methyltransferase CheR
MNTVENKSVDYQTEIQKGGHVVSRKDQLEEIEIDLICDGIFKYYGLDYRNYARSSLKRRLKKVMKQEGLLTISELQAHVLHDKRVMETLLLNLSINVTSMFRDPAMFKAFREKVVPILRTYPSVRIWHAGCSSGEEAYSMAILCEEEGLSDKVTIYATDMNEAIIQRAKSGIFSLDVMQEYTKNYMESGGTRAFSEYYTAKYGYAKLRPDLLNRITFSKHNLATDSSFNEFNVILCRNVMIYFNEQLQNRAHDLFHSSLCRFGTLIIGTKENVMFSSQQASYKEIDYACRIYQRKN